MSQPSSNQQIGELFTAVAHAEKYQSRNWIANTLVRRFMASLLQTVKESNSKDVHEVGCGEGHILGMLAQHGYVVRGCDVSQSSLDVAKAEAARLGLTMPVQIKSVYDLDPAVDSASTVMCCEVLEHLMEPETALKKLLSVAQKDLILSVPNEPIWHLLNMARGKYWYALGNTPGHFQHWSRSMFVNFVAQHAHIVSVKTPLPWTIVHCRPKR